jgi:hypothetical protein
MLIDWALLHQCVFSLGTVFDATCTFGGGIQAEAERCLREILGWKYGFRREHPIQALRKLLRLQFSSQFPTHFHGHKGFMLGIDGFVMGEETG